jgi:hypothetical protein
VIDNDEELDNDAEIDNDAVIDNDAEIDNDDNDDNACDTDIDDHSCSGSVGVGGSVDGGSVDGSVGGGSVGVDGSVGGSVGGGSGGSVGDGGSDGGSVDGNNCNNTLTISIYAIDGTTLIGYCGYKRYKWYIRKGLAEIKNENPLSIQLNFIHKRHDNNKSLINRNTICNCCGNNSCKLEKFNVFPICYKFHYSENVHDITEMLYICKNCLGTCNKFIETYKEKLYKEFNISPNEFYDIDKIKFNAHFAKIYKKKGTKNYKYIRCMKNLKKLLKMDESETFDSEQLDNYQSISFLNDTYMTIEKYIVNNYKNDYKQFTTELKRNFVLIVEPKYLPSDFY